MAGSVDFIGLTLVDLIGRQQAHAEMMIVIDDSKSIATNG